MHIKEPSFFVFSFVVVVTFFTYSAFQRAQTEYVYKMVCFFSKGAEGRGVGSDVCKWCSFSVSVSVCLFQSINIMIVTQRISFRALTL